MSFRSKPKLFTGVSDCTRLANLQRRGQPKNKLIPSLEHQVACRKVRLRTKKNQPQKSIHKSSKSRFDGQSVCVEAQKLIVRLSAARRQVLTSNNLWQKNGLEISLRECVLQITQMQIVITKQNNSWHWKHLMQEFQGNSPDLQSAKLESLEVLLRDKDVFEKLGQLDGYDPS